MEMHAHEFTEIYSQRTRSPPPSSLKSSSSLLGPPPAWPSSYDLCDRGALRPPKGYGFTVVALGEPTTYREVVIHPDWQHATVEEIAAMERTSTWHL